MRQVIILGILSLFFASCITTKKYSTFVNTKTKNNITKTNNEKDWLVVKSTKTQPMKNKYNQKKNTFIPAILYWEWNSTIECELDINIRTKYLKQGIYKAADSLKLKQHLGDNYLEINLKEMPGKFLYENKGKAVIYIIAYSVGGVEAISPYPVNLEFEFLTKENGNIKTKGNGFVQNEEQPLKNMWKSTKKFTWVYLDEFQKETNRMGTELVLGIIEELNKNQNK